jgi:hypothetical protein
MIDSETVSVAAVSDSLATGAEGGGLVGVAISNTVVGSAVSSLDAELSGMAGASSLLQLAKANRITKIKYQGIFHFILFSPLTTLYMPE